MAKFKRQGGHVCDILKGTAAVFMRRTSASPQRCCPSSRRLQVSLTLEGSTLRPHSASLCARIDCIITLPLGFVSPSMCQRRSPNNTQVQALFLIQKLPYLIVRLRFSPRRFYPRHMTMCSYAFVGLVILFSY